MTVKQNRNGIDFYDCVKWIKLKKKNIHSAFALDV